MFNIMINSVNFNYENNKVKNVTIVYRAQTEDYQHNLSGNLKMDKDDYKNNLEPEDLVKVVKNFILGLLEEKTIEEIEDSPDGGDLPDIEDSTSESYEEPIPDEDLYEEE